MAGVAIMVAIYRHALLACSETFVSGQVAAMRRFAACFVGARRVEGLSISAETPSVVLPGSGFGLRVREWIFQQTGWGGPLERWMRDSQVGLIHAHFATDGVECVGMARRLGVPLVVTLHGFDVTVEDAAFAGSRSGRRYLRRRERLFGQAELFICVSQHIAECALARGFPAEKLWVNPLGVDLQKFRPQADRRRERVVLFAARMVEKKGAIHLLRAMREVQRRDRSIRLVMIGEGPERRALEKFALAELHAVMFLGEQPAERVREWMGRSMVFCVPSVRAANGDREGLPIALCEAMAMGLPCVGFNGPGVNEAILHGDTGLLAEMRDEAGLADSILRMFEDHAFWRRCSVRGRRRAEDAFDVVRQTARLEARYAVLMRPVAEQASEEYGMDESVMAGGLEASEG